MLIKIKYMKDDKPFGKSYTFKSDWAVKIGDVVLINEKAKGLVIGINIPESEVADFEVKSIVGKVADND